MGEILPGRERLGPEAAGELGWDANDTPLLNRSGYTPPLLGRKRKNEAKKREIKLG